MIDLSSPNRDELIHKWYNIIYDKTFRIYTWTTLSELAWIAEYASRATEYLEIGAYAGRSTKIALLSNPALTINVLDTWDDEGVQEDFEHNLRKEIHQGRVHIIKGISQETIKKLDGRKFDACWIDAGHLEHLVEADVLNSIPLMKPGTLMSGHDYDKQGKNDVYRGVHKALPGKPIGNPVDHIWTYQL